MVRGGKVGSRKNFKKKFRPKDKCSDDSDEDYVVSNDEIGVSECSDEDYCSYLDENASGEDNFVVEEEQQPKKVRKGVRPKAKNAFGSCKEKKKNGRKRRRFSYQEEEDDGDEDDEDYSVDDDNDYEEEEEVEEEEEEEEEEVEEEEDVDVDEEAEDEDEDFMLEEEDFSDEEEPLVRKRAPNMKRGRQGVRKSTAGKACKKRKPKAAKKPSRNKRRKKSVPRTLRNSEDDDFSDNYRVVKNARRKKPVSRRNNYVAQSDFDTFLSGSSEYEYTISEEEREQVREAEKLCGHLRNRVRTVPSPPRIEESDLRQQRKPRPPVRKGKEKVEEVKVEVKQVCGICLSEEDKRRVRGTLNCCSHFFCFSCIMEWAKVESRCPLCKQRFQTISKPARSTAGIDLREVIIQVPERDQVYQPSEEELRSYLDPYENVICTECHEGGDDNLMLLCDLCDSPAHTYCVGLGREVPEGNWYCVDCTTTAIAQESSPQPPSRLSDRRTNNLFNRTFPVANREGLDLNSLSSPRTPIIQGFGNIPSPRLPVEVQSTSPMSQAVAPTLVRRRILRLHINNLRSSNQMGLVNNRTDGVSAANPHCGGNLSSQMVQGRETAAEHSITQNTAISSPTLFGENVLQENPSPLMQHVIFLDSETSHLPGQVMQDPRHSMPIDRTSSNGTILNPLRGFEVENSTTVDRNLNGALWPKLGGVNSLSNCEQIDQYDNKNTGSDNGLHTSVGDEKDYCTAREALQPMIESHLKNYLSADVDLGHITANDIATKAAGTILAACGFKHSNNEACRASPPAQCSHIELSMGEEQRSLINGLCSTCFDSYVGDVVKKITDDSWLNLSL